MNYGHTVGHGVELASAYRVRHGEAVAIGMVPEARLAERIGLAATRTWQTSIAASPEIFGITG